uniref:Uncharacterized protein n=1 Tax=Noctiluca scintillans TaxID=2966 RepID=A0A7S0ZZS9_NOCSC|mmetsp:Transcript_25663/g.67124  ORF Transcript_25663/g.67124 Transcript_25663/m.67124 type:complete len:127 (+) Transcript_25663:42-422(+)
MSLFYKWRNVDELCILLRGSDVVHHNVSLDSVKEEAEAIAGEALEATVEEDGILLRCASASGKRALMRQSSMSVFEKDFVLLDRCRRRWPLFLGLFASTSLALWFSSREFWKERLRTFGKSLSLGR